MIAEGIVVSASTAAVPPAALPYLVRAVSSTPKLVGRLEEHLQQRRDGQALRRLLGIRRSEGYEYRVGVRHPNPVFHEPLHPDDLAAFLAVAPIEFRRAARTGQLVTRQLGSTLEENLVLIGSAESEALTRLAFGYRRKNREAGLEFVGNTFRPAIRWEEDPDSTKGHCIRRISGGHTVRRPNFPVVLTESNEWFYPETSNDDYLVNDYLIISVLPNFLTEKAMSAGKRLISIGGTHGIGTRAIANVLNDPRCLRRISREVGDNRYFQTLVEVTKISDFPKHGSVPKEVVVRYVKPIIRSRSEWHDATEGVASAFTDWRLDDEPFNDLPPQDRR